jgi:hypothetical protein
MARKMRSLASAAALSLVGCAANNSVPVTEISSTAEVVSVAAARASEPFEFGGEKDAFVIESMGKVLAAEEDQVIVDHLQSLDARSVASLRVFFKPSDFEGQGKLIGGIPKPESLNYLNELPIPPKWPIEVATSTAWGEEDLRLDWKAKSTQSPSGPRR